MSYSGSYGYGSYGGFFDQNRTILAGIPRATLLLWQPQLQAALLAGALGTRPLSLSYTQGDGAKNVAYNVTTFAEIAGLLMLVNRILGYPSARRPMRPYFR
jgi:hypothetical protein